jgi:hypothetical protein
MNHSSSSSSSSNEFPLMPHLYCKAALPHNTMDPIGMLPWNHRLSVHLLRWLTNIAFSIPAIHLSERNKNDRDGYYYCTAKIQLP